MTRSLTVAANLGLVHKVAHRYRWAARGALEYDDLVQAGVLGLMRALRTFEPSRGALSTFAVPWIRHFIQRMIANEGCTVRRPCHLWLKQGAPRRELSLDAPRGESAGTLLDTLASEAQAADDALEAAEREAWARRALSCLDERERTVIEACTMGDEPLAAVARRIPSSRGSAGVICRERARQIQECALSRMRREIRQLAAE